MKLYEILNEKYLGKKFKLIEDGIEGECAIDIDGEYGYVVDNVWVLNERDLLEDIELIESEEDKYEKIQKNPIKITDYEYLEDSYIEVSANYKDYCAFNRYNDVLCIKSIDETDDVRISITFEEFDKIVEYVERLKELKTK